MTASMFIGRYQPFHEGHKKLIDTVLDKGGKVVIALRDTQLSDTDPYTIKERVEMIKQVYPDAVFYPEQPRITIVAIPDVLEICYGRKVGWGIRQIHLDKETEQISATKIRNKMKQ